MWFQCDMPQRHSCVKLLHGTYHALGFSCGELVEWPPRAPDLTTYFFPSRHLKSLLYSPNELPQLVDDITAWLNAVSTKVTVAMWFVE
ncbi:hypothetical protein PR048_016461 [Dryococelus australis]|uniref:Uncharacterized protein n=1 Tax=Dryococelus australis TaxID=614101 RepID=A0ABQ9HK77_9NEOP|nr:hypothetical protein PR048_016461 [Dryococelus australis]